MNKTIKTKAICEIIDNIDNPKEAKKIEDTINKVIKEKKNKLAIGPQNNKTIRNDRFRILSESVIMPIMACKQNITKQGLFRTLE